MDFAKDFLGYNFTWFIGEVEDRNDPLKLGRVRVRCFGWHSSDKELQPATQLPWANTIQPVTGPATTAAGLTKGVWVFGFFLDGNKAQRPMVLGHIPGYRFGSPGESELPRAARNEPDYQPPGDVLRDGTALEEVIVDPNEEQPGDPKTGQVNSWSEPPRPTDAVYPTALVNAHESGTYTQIAGSGRYTIQTNNGSYIEIDAGGNGKWKVITDNYEIVGGSKYVNVAGTVNMTVKGNVVNNIEGSLVENITGNVTRNITGTLTETVTGAVEQTYEATKTESVTVAVTETYQADHSTSVSGSASSTISGSATETVSGSKTSTSSGSYTIDGSSISIG